MKYWKSATAAEMAPSLELGVPRIFRERIGSRIAVTPASVSVPLERVTGIDLLRILAALGIIWFHMGDAPYRVIGYAGLPVFLLIFSSLIARQGPAHTTKEFARRRWDRLLKPWLFWSAVYGAGKLFKAVSTMDASGLWQMLSLETCLVGTCIHLWYLPYAFVCALLIHTINQRTWRSDNTLVVLTATFVGVLTLAGGTAVLQARQLPLPLPQWAFGLAAVPLGLALGRSLVAPSHRTQVLLLLMIVGVVLGACLILTLLGLDAPAVPYGLAIVLVCLAYRCPVSRNGFVAAVAPLAFGIYLVHPLALYGVKHFLFANGNYAVLIALTACLCGLITFGLRKTPLRRFV